MPTNFNNFKLPDLKMLSQEIQSIARPGNNISQFIQNSSSPSDNSATESAAERLYQGMSTSTLFKNQIEEFYLRGINILQPEIVMTSEYVPIIKSHDEEPGLQVALGSKKINVNQVLKLIELHTAVQESINQLSEEFVFETAGIDIEKIYNEAKAIFETSMYRSDMESTVDKFITVLSNNLHAHDSNTNPFPKKRLDDSSPKPFTGRGQRSSNSRSGGNLTNSRTSNANADRFLDLFKSANGKSTDRPRGRSGRRFPMIKFVSFRQILLNGSDIQKNSIKRILEIIIIEHMSSSLFGYFSEIIHLKEVVIPKYLDIKRIQITSGLANGDPHDNMLASSKSYIQKLKDNYVSVEEDTSTLIPLLSEGGELSATSKNPFTYVSEENIARTLGFKSIDESASNYEIIYALLMNVFKTLTFKNCSHYNAEDVENDRYKFDTLKSNVSDKSNHLDSHFQSRVEDFFHNTITSSFIYGGGVATRNAPYSFYTSHTINKYAIEKGLNYTAPEDLYIPFYNKTIKQMLKEGSMPLLLSGDKEASQLSNSNTLSPLRDLASFDGGDLACELFTASIYDVVYSNNKQLVNTSQFQENLNNLSRYEKSILGKNFGLSLPPSIAGLGIEGRNEINLGEFVEYVNEDSLDIKHSLGKIGDVIFATRKILDQEVTILPGANQGYPNLYKTISGDTGIAVEAFDSLNIKSLKSYNKSLERFLLKNITDIDKLFGKIIDPLSQLQDGQAFANLSTRSVFNKIMEEASNSLLGEIVKDINNGGISQIASGVDFTGLVGGIYFKKPLYLLLMALAAEDHRILSALFTCFMLRDTSDGGYYGEGINAWRDTLRHSAASRCLHLVFTEKFGKSLQRPTSMTINSEHQYTDYFSVNYETADFTFINGSKFNGSVHRVGSSDNSFDTSSNSDKIVYAAHNSINGIFKTFTDVLMSNDSNGMRSAINYFNNLTKNVPGYVSENSDDYTHFVETGVEASEPPTSSYAESRKNDATLTGDAPEYYFTYLKKEHEMPNRFDFDESLLGSSQVQREFSIFAFLCKLVSKTIGMEVKFNGDFNEPTGRLEIKFSQTQLISLRKLMKNKVPDYKSYDFMTRESFRNIYGAVKSNYNAMLTPFYERENKVKKSYAVLFAHINSMYKLENKIDTTLSEDALNDATKLALDYYGFKSRNSARRSPRATQVFDPYVKKSFLNFLSSTSYPAMLRNFVNNNFSSKQSILIAPEKTFTNRQVYQMTLALSKEGYGFSQKEKSGKKTIISVGIPPGLLSQISVNAQVKNGDNDYFYSPYVCLHIFKKDAVGGNILYYPKPYIFNTQLETFENFDSGFKNLELPDHELNYESINSFDTLLKEFSLYKYTNDSQARYTSFGVRKVGKSYKEMLSDPDDFEYIDQSNLSSKSNVLREIKINHMMDHYLKYYRKITTGIDTSENVFPVYSENRKTGEVDSRVRELYETYRDQLFLRYPSINVDQILAREFLRLEKNIADTRFFSLDQRAKNIFAPKCFSKIFNVFVNEADFVAYPYPDRISFLPPGVGSSENDRFVSDLKSLYGESTCPYFPLDGRVQINGINIAVRDSMVTEVSSVSALNNLVSENMTEPMTKLFGKQKQFFKHMNEVEYENVSDAYEFFAVVSVIRRK